MTEHIHLPSDVRWPMLQRMEQLEQLVREYQSLLANNPLRALPESVDAKSKQWFAQEKALQQRAEKLLEDKS